MLLTIETTTGTLVPPGLAPALRRGGLAPVTLRFLTDGVAALLPEGAPFRLALYSPGADEGLAALETFALAPDGLSYRGEFDTLAGGLAAVEAATLFGVLTYGEPAATVEPFHVRYGAH